jgi:hypothetical protein
LEAEHSSIYGLTTGAQVVVQGELFLQTLTSSSKLPTPTATLAQAPLFYTLQFDKLFPDLFTVTQRLESMPYENFLKFSLFRMGLKEHQLWEMFSTDIEHY